MEGVDAVVIGSGPNGLSAAIRLAQEGWEVLVLEAASTPGGGMRTAELTLPGFHHDVCSACHPMGVLSPYWRTLPLAEHGLTWDHPLHSVAHPLDDRPAMLLTGSVDETAALLGADGAAYRRLLDPLVRNAEALFADALGPLGIPSRPDVLARFGLNAWRSCTGLARAWFDRPETHALLAGMGAHSVQPLDNPLTGAMTLMFLIAGHRVAWPVARGGSQSITHALVGVLESLGGRVQTDSPVTDLRALPPCRAVLLDTSPDQLITLGADHLPPNYLQRLDRYAYGPASFKLDFALDGPIPWADARVADASTVHVGGSMEEIAAGEREAYEGHVPERPYVLMVQQSQFDATRAPSGKHTGYAYIHVPSGCDVDCTETIVRQIERFAPGFRDRILATHTTTPAGFHAYNLNNVGGAVTGGLTDMTQLFTRPVARLDPYSTPHPQLTLCSASTPPGGGVHGMCGYHAAGSAMRRAPLERTPW